MIVINRFLFTSEKRTYKLIVRSWSVDACVHISCTCSRCGILDHFHGSPAEVPGKVGNALGTPLLQNVSAGIGFMGFMIGMIL